MNFNVYFEDELGAKLEAISRKSGQSRNALIREAVREFLHRYEPSEWSESIKKFSGLEQEGINFESYRDELVLLEDEGIFS